MKTLVVAPHPDDELLGCGGTLLRRKADGGAIGWLIVTGLLESEGWAPDRIRTRDAEIDRVAATVGFDRVYNLRLPTTKLDAMPRADVIGKFSDVFKDFAPVEVFVPHPGDVHSDHRVCFEAALACTKWFRYPSVRRVLAYETLSETDFGLDPTNAFHPNVFVDVTEFIDRKIAAMEIYKSELAAFPFPRSVEALRALAAVRGAAAGVRAAEAFQLYREIEGR